MNCRNTVGAIGLLLVLLTTVPPRAQTPAPGGRTAPVSCESQAGIIKPFGAGGEAADLLCDSDGLIVHRANDEHPYGDGGDTAQREGWYWLGVWLRQNTPGLQPWPHRRKLNFDQVLRLLEPNRDGVFYRHPRLAPWNNPHDKKFGFSRDQMVPLVAAMGVWGKQEELRRLWDALPDDALGKHSFNGNWRNLLGQDGVDCTAIRRRSCDATRSCPLKSDTRDCSLKTDTRSCPLQEDTRSCNICLIPNPWGGCILYGNDPACELAKAAQNAIYKANKDACEAAKAAQNLIYAGEKTACEAAKATQNAIYKAEKDACEVVKAGEKLTCEAQKTADWNICRLSNIHSGDFIGPATENLFARARNERLSDWKGEAELLANVLLRIHDASDRDNTGDDLNLLVILLMSKLRTPTTQSESSVALYASMRPFSYGSYLKSYRAFYGNDATDMTQRIDAGIARGWKADAPPANGAVHWYHRVETGGNEQLAELYDPIINWFIYGDKTVTPGSTNPSPTISSVTPPAGLSSGGTVLSISGTGFTSGTTVLIDGVPAVNVVVVSSMIVRAVTPPHADGPVGVSVTVPWPGGGTATRPGAFTYRSTAPAPLPVLPIGTVDTPIDNQTGVTGAIPFTGWALDDNGVESVNICRAAVTGESAPVDANCGGSAQVYVGAGVFIDGARPDVQAAYPWYPQNNRAGWGFMLLTNMLPNRGNGTFVFSIYARDREGQTSRLGMRSLTCDNARATRPFGTIDTPAQGATVSGTSYVNFGWALTQNPKAIPSDGSTMTVYIDGVAVGSPLYNHYRSDIATLFPGLVNSQGAIGYHRIDTTALSNGLHTISWTVTDSNRITAGLGSRFFRVANGITATAESTSAQAAITSETSARDIAAAPRLPVRLWDAAAGIRRLRGGTT